MTERGGGRSWALSRAARGLRQAPAGQAAGSRASRLPRTPSQRPNLHGPAGPSERPNPHGPAGRPSDTAAPPQRNEAGRHARRRARGARKHRWRRLRPREPLGGDTGGQFGAPGEAAGHSQLPPGPVRPSPATFRILPRPTLRARRGTPVSSRESLAAAPALSRARRR